MKRKIKRALILVIILLSIQIKAADPPPPPSPNGGNPSGDPVGGGAPIGSGLLILLGLGGAYGGYKIYQKKKKSLLD